MKKIHVIMRNWKVVIIVVRRNVNDLRNGGIRVSLFELLFFMIFGMFVYYIFEYVSVCGLDFVGAVIWLSHDGGVCSKGGQCLQNNKYNDQSFH